jgi:Protein of unknown function (DUF2934).
LTALAVCDKGGLFLFAASFLKGNTMSRESTEALKARLLSDSEVQLMIRMRAYEIYQLHGGHGGNSADDWFRAESEVLSFLIDEENRRAAEEAQAPSPETVAGVELVARSDESGDPETSVGAWSATEPTGLELAPAIGGEAAMETPKKSRARSTTKTTSSRAKKAGDGSTKKSTTQRTASKKTADAAEKPKRTRKKTAAPTTQTDKP